VDVFGDEKSLPPMAGEPMKIHLEPNAVPFKLKSARDIPIHYLADAKAELDNMVASGVITRHTEPSEWAHPIVVVPKSRGGVRICVDLTRLNRFVRRPYHPVLSPSAALTRVPPNARFFTTMDATKGYHQVELDRASQDLTVFLTPWGRYRYTRAPLGLSAAGDEYGSRSDPVQEGKDYVVP